MMSFKVLSMNIAGFLQLAKRSLIRLLHYLVHRVQKDKSFVSGCKNILKMKMSC